MPLHLLGKKSWNVYNAANIARVKADEEAAAVREAAQDQRMQEIDAARRAAILRGQTPPPLPEDDNKAESKGSYKCDVSGKKRRKLRGEDDTDADIRWASSRTGIMKGEHEDAKVLKLRKPTSDAPLMDHAGNINLFPVDVREIAKREKNEEAEKEKKKKAQTFEDQYTMRLANAAGRQGLESPWYASGQRMITGNGEKDGMIATAETGTEDKDVWGNDDPRRKEREQMRLSSSDPFAVMQKAQVHLKRSRDDRRKWEQERGRELRELKLAQKTERDKRKTRQHRSRDSRSHDPISREGHRSDYRSTKHKHRRRSPSHDSQYGHK